MWNFNINFACLLIKLFLIVILMFMGFLATKSVCVCLGGDTTFLVTSHDPATIAVA